MGILSDRFTQRKSPLNALATRIVRAASSSALNKDDQSFEAIQALVLETVQEHEPADLEKLVSLVLDEAELRQDAEDVVDEVRYFVETACSAVHDKDGTTIGRMLAIPLMVTGSQLAWTLSLTPGLCEALTDVLKEASLIVPDAKVTYMPRMLLPAEAEHMFYGSLHRIMHALSEGDLAYVQELLDSQRDRMELAGAFAKDLSTAQDHGSIAVLAAYVATTDLEPFPLAMEMRNALPAFPDVAEDEIARSPEVEQATEVMNDVTEILKDVGVQVAEVLGLTTVHIDAPTEDWFDGVASTRRLEREMMAMYWVRETAQTHVGGAIEDLCASQHIESDEDTWWTVIRLQHKYTTRVLAEFKWQVLSDEDDEDCAYALSSFFSAMKLTPPEENYVVTALPLGKPKVLN